jgi:ribosomal protein L11 methylase PrmA
MTRLSFLGLIDSLESAIKNLKWQAQGTEWADYYSDTNYSSEAFQHKKQTVAQFLDKIRPNTVWDVGGNVGTFSRIASDKEIHTVSFDIDVAAVERNYLECVRKGESNILPLVLDLTNPSPSIGWENRERTSWIERGPADMVLALALIHHLAISNNLPLDKIAYFFSSICSGSIVIEFVPKSDSQVQRLLSAREDIFPDYTQDMFETEFENYFRIENSVKSQDSDRALYLMKRRI